MPKIKDLDMLKDIGVLYENELILYGAGDYGNRALRLLEKLKIPILGFCDSNKSIWGEEIEEYKVFSFEELKQHVSEKNVIIIVTMADPQSVEQVISTLDDHGMSEVPCYTYFALQYTVGLHIGDKRIPLVYRERFEIAKRLHRELWLGRIELDSLAAICDIISHNGAVLVLQPGKVGSKSVEFSLKRNQVNCIHSHLIAGPFLGCHKWEEERKSGIDLIHQCKKDVKIISMVRDPIGRDISLYFELFYEGYTHDDIVIADSYKGVNALLEHNIHAGDYGWIFEWYNRELREIFGIDIYKYRFDKTKGYQIIKENNVELLLIKTEKLDECEGVITRFVGAKKFSLLKENAGINKLYKFAYNDLKRTIEIPEYVLDFYYKGNKGMDHFYTAKEKEEFIKRWKRK